MELDAERPAALGSGVSADVALAGGGMVDDLRALLRLAAGRTAEPSAVIIVSQTLRSTPESGERAGYDGGKRKKAFKLRMAVDTLATCSHCM